MCNGINAVRYKADIIVFFIAVGTDCGQPPPIENGFDPEYVSTGVGATAIYSCNPGYSIKNNNNQLICNERGMWVITPPVCNGRWSHNM